MMKKAIISSAIICSILLVGCSNNDVLESELEAALSQETISSELQNELIASITEETELDSESLAIIIDGGVDEYTVSVGFPNDADSDGEMIQKLVEEVIQDLSETEAATEDKIVMKIKVEQY